MRSPFEGFEEWLFKNRRKDACLVFAKTVDEAADFKKFVSNYRCPSCKGKLEVVKFERGPKGWEADLSCQTCRFTAVISSLSSVLLSLDSKGKAREK